MLALLAYRFCVSGLTSRSTNPSDPRGASESAALNKGMTLKEIITEAKNVRIEDFGYKKQESPVVDGHISYIKGDKIILIDEPGKEWHLMEKGVVTKVGEMSDGSLKRLLSGVV